MDSLIIPATEFTPKVTFMIESGHFEISGISRPEDVAGFYNDLLNWLIGFEHSILKSGNKYKVQEFRFIFKMSYFNSSSSKYIIQMLRHVKNLKDSGLDLIIDWYMKKVMRKLWKMVKILQKL